MNHDPRIVRIPPRQGLPGDAKRTNIHEIFPGASRPEYQRSLGDRSLLVTDDRPGSPSPDTGARKSGHPLRAKVRRHHEERISDEIVEGLVFIVLGAICALAFLLGRGVL